MDNFGIIKNIINSSKLPQKETEDYHFLLMYILLQEAKVGVSI